MGGDDAVERLPIVSGQQTHLSGGFTSSKLPHMHVCICTHTHTGASHTRVHHTYGCITHTCVHTQRHMKSTDIHMTDTERHTCNTDTQKDTHTAHTYRTQARIHPLQPSLQATILSAPLSPGQGLQLPLAGPGQVLESLRQSQRAPLPLSPSPILTTRCASCSVPHSGSSSGHRAGVGGAVNAY